MSRINLRQWLYFTLVRMRGQRLGANYYRFLKEDRAGIDPETTMKLLIKLLSHCHQMVPFYREIMDGLGNGYQQEPEAYLRQFPVLTKEKIRGNFDALKSLDLHKRKWFYNSSSGSTGEPIQFIQDWDHAGLSGATKLFFSKLAGREIGELEICFWGSLQEITDFSESWQAKFMIKLSNTILLNAFHMLPDQMEGYIQLLNTRRPRLILSYADTIYDLARYIEENDNISVVPQHAIMSSASMLYPVMRETIERVFQCKVYNRYGTREIGDIACERPGVDGFWVAPWNAFVEIVDEHGYPVPDGTEGDILLTSLTNLAMPLVRYKVGDRGVLAPKAGDERGFSGQILQSIDGRDGDLIHTRDGKRVHLGYFAVLLYHMDWIMKFQMIQKSQSHITYRIIKTNNGYDCSQDLEVIKQRVRQVMGEDCRVDIALVDDIPVGSSGKYKHLISEMSN